ncbi:MAG: S8 family serine peptidase [Bacteroidales bacterium]|nr:S8 family serine peptidase [Bacteroidales bacterium]
MKKLFLFLVCLAAYSLQAQKPVSFQSVTPPPRPAGSPAVSNFAPNTRMFLQQWNEYQNALQMAQSTKSAQGVQTAQTRLSQLKDTYGLRPVKSAKGAVRYELPVFVRYESEAALQSVIEKGLKVNTKLQTICTGVIAPEDLPALNGLSGIRYVETSTKATPSLDSARIFSQVDAAHQGGIPYGSQENEILAAYRGEDVVVGIVDQGFDYTHPTFYDPFDNSVYRVQRVWDQMAESGTAPKGYNYGVEYTTTADILAAQHDHWENASHGSHVAGIAGGSGAGTPYGGMAPKSDLVFVPTTMQTLDIFNGITYIKEYAESQQKPCVVNLSIGSHLGPHDGTSSFDYACDEMKSNGFILVGAAGNEGSMPLYLQHRFTALTKDTLMFSCIEFQNSFDKTALLDIWSDNDDDFYICIGLLHPSGEFISETKPFASYMTDTTQHLMEDEEIAVTIDFSSEHNPDNGKARIYAYIDASPLNGAPDDFEGYTIVMMLGSIRTNRTMSVQMWLNVQNAIFTNTGFENHPLFKAGSVSHTVG